MCFFLAYLFLARAIQLVYVQFKPQRLWVNRVLFLPSLFNATFRRMLRASLAHLIPLVSPSLSLVSLVSPSLPLSPSLSLSLSGLSVSVSSLWSLSLCRMQRDWARLPKEKESRKKNCVVEEKKKHICQHPFLGQRGCFLNPKIHFTEDNSPLIIIL